MSDDIQVTSLVVNGHPYKMVRIHQSTCSAESYLTYFEQALDLRLEIFVEEQSVPLEEEMDDHDAASWHWIFFDENTNEPVATGRMFAYQEACQSRPVAKIGRLAVKKANRGLKLGHYVMQAIMETVQAESFEYAILDAQVQALGFYEKLGFIAEGLEFMDGGIPHYRMRYSVPVFSQTK